MASQDTSGHCRRACAEHSMIGATHRGGGAGKQPLALSPQHSPSAIQADDPPASAQTPSPTHLLWFTLTRSDIGKLFASAGDDQLAVMIHVPAAIAEKLSVKEWAETVAKDVGLEVNSIEGEFAKVGVYREEVWTRK